MAVVAAGYLPRAFLCAARWRTEALGNAPLLGIAFPRCDGIAGRLDQCIVPLYLRLLPLDITDANLLGTGFPVCLRSHGPHLAGQGGYIEALFSHPEVVVEQRSRYGRHRRNSHYNS